VLAVLLLERGLAVQQRASVKLEHLNPLHLMVFSTLDP
jgi:hypothetical protein